MEHGLRTVVSLGELCFASFPLERVQGELRWYLYHNLVSLLLQAPEFAVPYYHTVEHRHVVGLLDKEG